ncbi:MAG: hypothetical protein H6514_00855 [Acidimicrobiaceae bacterium]|nr:hypothetical protein [Acidimicrobiaceae bacterium]
MAVHRPTFALVSGERAGDPSDHDLEQVARSLTIHHRRRLRRLVRELDDVRDRVAVTARSRSSSNVVWPAYSESALDLYHVLRVTGLVVAFDWVTWLERSGYRRDRPPSSLSVADAVRHVTAVVRADRAAGTFAAALVDGSLLRSIDIILGAADTGRADAPAIVDAALA